MSLPPKFQIRDHQGVLISVFGETEFTSRYQAKKAMKRYLSRHGGVAIKDSLVVVEVK